MLRAGLLAAAWLVCSATPPKALAQNNTYENSKTITITPDQQAQGPTVTIQHFEHAWVSESTKLATSTRTAVDPQAQAAGFNKDGYDGYVNGAPKKILVNSNQPTSVRGFFPAAAVTVPVSLAEQLIRGNFDNTGKPFSVSPAALPTVNLSAEANSSFKVKTARNGKSITATMKIDGSRTPVPLALPKGITAAEDYAFSYSGLKYTGAAVNANKVVVTVNPTFFAQGTGALVEPPNKPQVIKVAYIKDPVTFSAVASDGKSLVSGTAMEIDAGVVGNGQINWTYFQGDLMNHVHIGGLDTNGEAYLSMFLDPSLVGSGHGGSYTLDVVDGQVVQASESGIFASLALPQVGSSFSSLDLNVPGSDFALNLAVPKGAQTYTVGVDDLGGTIGSTSVPEPSTLVLAGIACTIIAACRILKRRARPTGAVCCVALAIVLAGAPRARAGSILLTLELLEEYRSKTGVGDSAWEPGELEQAARSFQGGDFETCLKQLGQAVRAHPELPPTHALFAELASRNDQAALIRPALERASGEDPAHPAVFLLFGDLAVREGRWSDAALHFEKAAALASAPRWAGPRQDRFERLCLRGEAAVAEGRGDWKAAKAALQDWLKLEPTDAPARQRLGQALFRLDQWEAAYQELQQAARDDTTVEPAPISMARLYTEAGDVKKAVKWLEYAVKAAPDSLGVRVGRAAWLLDRGRTEQAQAEAEAAARIDPLSPAARRLLGLAARARKDLARAEPILEALDRESPGVAWVHSQLALVLAERTDDARRRRALELAQGLVRQTPTTPTPYTNAERVLPAREEYTRCVYRLKLSHLVGRTIPPGFERKHSLEW